MVDWIGLSLRTVTFYCYLIGLNNFEWDRQSGRVVKTWRCTPYAATINIVYCTSLIYCWTGIKDFTVMFSESNMLQTSVIWTVTFLRIIAGLSTLLNRWRQRNQLIKIIRNILRLLQANQRFYSSLPWGTFIKILATFAIDLLHVALAVQAINPNSGVKLRLSLQIWSFSIANLAVFQYFLLLLFVRTQYQVINAKLRQVIDESERLSYLAQRQGGFMTRCCCLSDQLDGIAELQAQLPSIFTRFGEVLGLQAAAVISEYYMTSVSFGYLIYSAFRNGQENLNVTRPHFVITCIWYIVYNLRGMLGVAIMFCMLDEDKKTYRLLEKRTLFASRLDVRLEKSFDSFHLQLVRNPLKLDVIGMFIFTRTSIAAMFGSIIMHTILLIQCDLENF
ncbi:hypothetical protein KR084_004511 [Drosophila pseudotakahashii]|nr:hypothetical protein KR084_004511 [Drosophila pseudotakahashii]